MVSMSWQPRKDNQECRNWWDIFHRVLGYALIFLVMANIFVGINNQSNWKWVYVTILAVLALTSFSLEVYRWWFKSKPTIPHTQHFNNNVCSIPP